MNLIILGPQGSGKGTQAKLLAERFGLTHISTGELMRNEIDSGSDFGKEIKSIINKGDLVSDEILFSVLEKAPLKSGHGFILDGTPRNLFQAVALEKVFAKVGLTLDKVISIDIPHDVSVQRMLKRAEIEHRPDDTLEAIKKRLAIYENETRPVVYYYRKQNKVIDIDGTPDIDTIFLDIVSKLENKA
jgi:adenylate kinase